MVELKERAAFSPSSDVRFSLEFSENLAANFPQPQRAHQDMVEILVELMMYMLHLLGRDWWWKFQAELMSERKKELNIGKGERKQPR